MSAVLALLSSVLWGVSDFFGGMTSRRVDPLRVTVQSTPYGIVPLLVFSLLIPGTLTSAGAWAGVGAGLAGGFGILLLYVALAAGPMGVMSPLTAVVSAVVPVVVGLVRGERPGAAAYLGMLLAAVAIVLVSAEPQRDDDASHHRVQPRVVAIAVASGLCIGAYLAFIGIAPEGSGIWPVLVSRVVASLVVLGIALTRSRRGLFVASVAMPAMLIGVLDSTANAVYRVSAQSGMLAVVSVLAALYPAATVVLARFVLHERLRPVQAVGMGTALTAAALLAAGG